ncbi:MAG: lytic murein transglycosylase [Bdellovibrionaceae bacterium]|nr:lytic murein transglycosylase [Pseudobdellovibrionaceae bacterium]
MLKGLGLTIVLFSSALAFGKNPTPVMFSDLQAELPETRRAFRPPTYEGQEDALGYSPQAFAVPPGMEARVSFWIDIYTKYSTDQGLLHDSRYPEIVYESVDFRPIMQNEALNSYQKQAARRRLVKDRKKDIEQRLKRLQKYSSPVGLQGEDLRYWYLFDVVDEPNKFRQASHSSRLRFQLGQSDRFVKGIFYSGRYLEKMEAIFREEGLPIELTRLPFVESSFNVKAMSRLGASGIWQFLRGTGREYMRINASVDERNDPLTATASAAKKMKKNYNMLGNWPLAVTGYNHGPYGMRRMVKRYGTSDISELIEKRRGRFGFASANFYASFLAAVEVEKRAKAYFGEVYWDLPRDLEKLRLTKNISVESLVNWFDEDEALTRESNYHIRRSVWKGQVSLGRGDFVWVPKESYARAETEMNNLTSVALFNGKIYKVSPGDTLSGIANQFGVRLSKLIQANNSVNPRRLQVGQKLIIPTP